MKRSLPHPVDVKLGAAIRKYRTKAGLTLRLAALELGISNTMMLKYETGKARVSVSRMVEIADVLGVSPLTLLKCGLNHR